MKTRSAHGVSRVDVLLVQLQVDAGGLEVLDDAEQIDQRAAKPIDGPGHDNVEGSRHIADRLEERLTRTASSADDKALIEKAIYFFIAAADAERRSDCSSSLLHTR